MHKDKTPVLYATTNPTKLKRMREALDHLPLKILGLQDISCEEQVVEDGESLEENARKKALFQYQRYNIPTIAVDHGLFIDKFPENKQPGMFVRRINGSNGDVSDDEMRDYYINELRKVGGESNGYWITAIALIKTDDEIFCETYKNIALFTSQASENFHLGEPLSSIQIDPETGKYYSEMRHSERLIVQKERLSGIIGFIERHFDFNEPV